MKKNTIRIIDDLIERYVDLKVCYDDVSKANDLLVECFKDGNKLLTCGNGGSASDAQHIVGELMKAFILPRKIGDSKAKEINEVCGDNANYLIENLQGALPAISLVAETALTTAYANDMAADLGFAQQVYGYGNKGDILLAISTSGNSANVIYAAQIAKVQGMKVIGLTGETGGKLKALSDVCICAPSKETFKIQEFHLPIYHALCLAVENEFFGEE